MYSTRLLEAVLLIVSGQANHVSKQASILDSRGENWGEAGKKLHTELQLLQE